MPQGVLNPAQTAWHLTIGTYLSRPHGDSDGRPTVDRKHNNPGDPFIGRNDGWADSERSRARGEPVLLSHEQRAFVESTIPELCERGGWTYHMCAAPPPPQNDHIHLLVDALPSIHGKDIRKWLKRWLTERMNAQFGRRDWWVEAGSTKPVKDAAYFANVFEYDRRQRTTPCEISSQHAP